MSQEHPIYEPEIEPEDTHPTQTVPAVNTGGGAAGWQRVIGLLSLLGAFGFTFATILLLIAPVDDAPVIGDVETPAQVEDAIEVTDVPTVIPATAPPGITRDGQIVEQYPTLDPETAALILQRPLTQADAIDPARIDRDPLNPFTVIPVRPRNEVFQYTVQQGDTIEDIARRFGLEPESIVWSNPRRIIQVLRPGDLLNIPPVDGVYAEAIGSTRTIADYTELYKLDNPWAVIDSEFNNLGGFTPETVPPSGTRIFFPGGEAETIVWRAEIEVTQSGGGTAGSAAVDTVVFQNGQPGSCAPQPISGGTLWVSPLAGGYTPTQGFSSWHPGIDLAVPVGTPVRAANGGRVIFAGWNSFGYGYAIAIIHGPNMTVYGHLSEVWVRCGQDVTHGEVIGLSGNTGQSSGPHLHFEIRGRSGNTFIPLNPAGTIGF
jgi:murein DD-endopeptidase MepM/ murein hydrolase activator NlpD